MNSPYRGKELTGNSTPKTLIELQVLLEQSIKLQCRIIAEQDKQEFDKIHKEVLKEIEEQIMKLLQERGDNW